MRKLFLIFITTISVGFASDIIKIQVGQDYTQYSNQDLQRRVWELERAVHQLQLQVFKLKMGSNTQKPEPVSSWVCKTEAMGEKFSAVGQSKAIAENAVMEKCKSSPKSSSGFHCDTPSCSQ